MHEHATAHNPEARGNTAEMHGISPSWITRVPCDWREAGSRLCRDREIARDRERQRDILNYDGGINDCKHKERACMQTAGCAASCLPNDSCVPAALSTKLRNCTERANARGELGRSLHEPSPERAVRQHEPSPERADARESIGASKTTSCWRRGTAVVSATYWQKRSCEFRDLRPRKNAKR